MSCPRPVVLGLLALVACSPPPNLFVAGHEFRVEEATVVWERDPSGDLWWFQITDGPDPCAPAPDTLPPDDVWVYVHNYGGLSPDGPPHAEFDRLELRIQRNSAPPEDYVHYYFSSGEDYIELDDERLHVRFALVGMREGFEGPYTALTEPIEVELDVPYRTCEL